MVGIVPVDVIGSGDYPVRIAYIGGGFVIDIPT